MACTSMRSQRRNNLSAQPPPHPQELAADAVAGLGAGEAEEEDALVLAVQRLQHHLQVFSIPVGISRAWAGHRHRARQGAARQRRRRQNPGTCSSLPFGAAALDSHRTRLAAAAARESAGAAPNPSRGARAASIRELLQPPLIV